MSGYRYRVGCAGMFVAGTTWVTDDLDEAIAGCISPPGCEVLDTQTGRWLGPDRIEDIEEAQARLELRTSEQTAQLAVLHARGWDIHAHETDERQRLRVTGTDQAGDHFRGWLDADGQFTGQPTDTARSTQRFGVGAPGEMAS